MSSKAFILGAGLGTRMRPLTETLPKPLMDVAGRSLVERTLDQLEAAGVTDTVINTHYLADKLTDRLKTRTRPTLHFSYEETLLDTGGGIKKALSCFDEEFFVLSGDGLWTDGPDKPALTRMAEVWDPGIMDIVLLLQSVAAMHLTRGVGDYDIDETGRAVRSKDQSGAYMFTSMRINHPRIFDSTPEGAFSYLELMDRAEQQGRLYALVHDGEWHHISTPDDLAAVNATYQKRKTA